MKNKKMILAVAALVVLIGILMGVYLATRPDTVEGVKNVTVVIVYEDGTEKKLEYATSAEYLADLLIEENLVDGYSSEQYGYSITAVDGIYLDWEKDGAYWSLYEGDTYASGSAASIVLVEGGIYKLVYETL